MDGDIQCDVWIYFNPAAASVININVPTLKELQTPAFASGLDRLEIRILLCHALNLSRIELITHDQRAINQDELAQIRALITRRVQGEPIAYIVGWREFYGLRFQVSPAVLIPRPESELLVELALPRLPANGRLLDMGTGSGALAVALAHTRPDIHVSALDISAAALEVARENSKINQVTIQFMQSDWYTALPSEASFHVIVANPPYIVPNDPHLQQGDLRFEPISALTCGSDHDGLSALRTISTGAAAHLSAGGWLFMEHGYDQAPAVRQCLQQNGFTQIQSWCDLAGIERVSGGQRA